jgi:hypothetical protein
MDLETVDWNQVVQYRLQCRAENGTSGSIKDTEFLDQEGLCSMESINCSI